MRKNLLPVCQSNFITIVSLTECNEIRYTDSLEPEKGLRLLFDAIND